jgi:hypothetical protein
LTSGRGALATAAFLPSQHRLRHLNPPDTFPVADSNSDARPQNLPNIDAELENRVTEQLCLADGPCGG